MVERLICGGGCHTGDLRFFDQVFIFRLLGRQSWASWVGILALSISLPLVYLL